MNKKDGPGEIESPEKMSYIVLYCLTVLRLNLSGPSDMDIIRKAQSRHKTRVSQTSASKLNKAMCHFPDEESKMMYIPATTYATTGSKTGNVATGHTPVSRIVAPKKSEKEY
jgi:hypothetical protein